jgi:toxin ParE1/3/4
VIAVIVLSPLAEDDLVEIWCTVAVDDIRAADNLIDELHQVTRLLVSQPTMGRLRPEFGPDVRSFPHGNYLVLYRPATQGVGIARVVHGARDLASLQMA